MLAILIFRVIYSILDYSLHLPPNFPDSDLYNDLINNVIGNGMNISHIQQRLDVKVYVYAQSILRYLFGNWELLTIIINTNIGTLAIYNAGKIADIIYGKKAQFLTIILLSLYPSFLVYTTTNLRESIVLYLITLAFVNIVLYSKYNKNSYMLKYFFISIIIFLFRSVNLLFLLVIGMIAIYISNKKSYILKKWISVFSVVVIVLISLSIMSNFTNFSLDVNFINQQLNRDMSVTQDSLPYLIGERYKNWIDLIINIPKRLFYFTIYPFPWDLSKYKYSIPILSSIYDITMIFTIIIYLVKIKKKKIIHKDEKNVKYLMIYMIVGLIIYGVAKTEAATRHRLQFTWIMPVLVSCILNIYIDKKRMKDEHRIIDFNNE